MTSLHHLRELFSFQRDYFTLASQQTPIYGLLFGGHRSANEFNINAHTEDSTLRQATHCLQYPVTQDNTGRLKILQHHGKSNQAPMRVKYLAVDGGDPTPGRRLLMDVVWIHMHSVTPAGVMQDRYRIGNYFHSFVHEKAAAETRYISSVFIHYSVAG